MALSIKISRMQIIEISKFICHSNGVDLSNRAAYMKNRIRPSFLLLSMNFTKNLNQMKMAG